MVNSLSYDHVPLVDGGEEDGVEIDGPDAVVDLLETDVDTGASPAEHAFRTTRLHLRPRLVSGPARNYLGTVEGTPCIFRW